jgi:hypothetical protein
LRLIPLTDVAAAQKRYLVSALFLVIAVVIAYEASQYIVDEDYHGAVYAIGLLVGCAGVVIILNDWRRGLYILLGWLLFEDFVRKFMGNNMAIYFVKDALTIITMLSFTASYLRKQVKSFRPPFLIPLAVFVWLGVLQMFNPASPHLIFGLLGIKLYYFYIPLMFAGYALPESEADLRKFFWFNLLLAVIIAGLGIAQAVLGHTFLNPEVAAEEIRELSTLYRTAPLSGVQVYRPTSVFVSDGRFASYMVLSLILAFGFSGYLLLRNAKGKAIAAVGLAVIAVACVLTSSRGALMWGTGTLLVGSAAFLWGAPWRQRQVVKVLRTVWRTSLVIFAGILLVLLLNPGALLDRVAFYSETLLPSSSQSELGYRTYVYPIKNFIAAFDYPRWNLGYGIGTESLGVQYVAKFFHASSPVGGVENGYGTLVLEFGIVGLFVWLVMTFFIVRSCWKIVLSLRGSVFFPIAFVIAWFVFLVLFPFVFNGMVSYQNFVTNAYLWILIGFLFRIPKFVSAGTAKLTPGEVATSETRRTPVTSATRALGHV